jgi:hypothetical protein
VSNWSTNNHGGKNNENKNAVTMDSTCHWESGDCWEAIQRSAIVDQALPNLIRFAMYLQTSITSSIFVSEFE